MKNEDEFPGPDRRQFVKGMSAAATILAGLESRGALAEGGPQAGGREPQRKPNIVLYVADETRWDFIRAYGLNPSARTPNLDSVFERGVAFGCAVTNQPLCSPSRACMMTGRYATETDVWTLGRQLRHDLPTLATELRSNGYTANFIGKWHLSAVKGDEGIGFVRPEDRGGFLDVWEGANVLERTSHPYSGTIWDGDGKPIVWQDEYRVDFLTDRAVRFLKQPQEKPFLLFISQLEPHQQNDENRFAAPKGYAEKYRNPYVPPDLLHLPGNWQAQLPDYYGSIEKIDESVGVILRTLQEQNLLENTIFVFTSDHGCHFRTRNTEYKRSPHDSSIRVPLVMQGPGFDQSLVLSQVAGNIDLTPTLLDAAGVTVPSSMKGRSLMPLVRSPQGRKQWKSEQLIQISQSMVGRAIRTDEWTYCVATPNPPGGEAATSSSYDEYVMYNDFGDPAQLVNLVARVEYKAQAAKLREQLLQLIAQSGEPAPTITPARLYP